QQEKLSRIMGHIQAMLLMAWRTTRLFEAGKCNMARGSMTKAWTTKICREVAQLGREMMGGNGIILDNYAMKAVGDIEAIYTYEGTYDINSLVCARELTGIPAFK
ncbi:MAG: acyl-CoA dehydrogenase, partial [Flavobacterium sp.]